MFKMNFELVPAPIALLLGTWGLVVLGIHGIALLLIVLALAPLSPVLFALSLARNKHASGS